MKIKAADSFEMLLINGPADRRQKLSRVVLSLTLRSMNWSLLDYELYTQKI
jgi:hypothetical protein